MPKPRNHSLRGSGRVARLKAKAAERVATKQAVALRAVGYVRVSTDEQAASGFGLEAQERSVRSFAESQGYELVELVTDPAVSGASRPAERPGFGRVLELAQAGAFSVLLVHRFDRLARQIVYAVQTVSDLGAMNIQLRSVTEPIDTGSPVGRSIFALLAGMAENERHTITERTFGGRREKARTGAFAGGRVPFGYRLEDGTLAVDEAEAETVRLMFRLRNEGRTLEQIAAELNRLGRLTRSGAIWRSGRVAYVLDNPRYRGDSEYLFTWDGAPTHVLTRGEHAAII